MAAKILQYDSIEDFIVHNQNSRFSNILLNNKDMIKRNIGLIKLNRELDTSSVIIEKLSNTR